VARYESKMKEKYPLRTQGIVPEVITVNSRNYGQNPSFERKT